MTKLERLLDKLSSRISEDISIVDLFACIVENGEQIGMPSPRTMQQQLGPHISRINNLLKQSGFHVRPGNLKQTYRYERRG
jgi:hypothetical protein